MQYFDDITSRIIEDASDEIEEILVETGTSLGDNAEAKARLSGAIAQGKKVIQELKDYHQSNKTVVHHRLVKRCQAWVATLDQELADRPEDPTNALAHSLFYQSLLNGLGQA